MTDPSRSPADEHETPRRRRTAKAKPQPMHFLEFVKLRESIGTQDEVAVELETARRTLGRWERGERPVPGIAAVAIRLLADKAKSRREVTAIAMAGIVAEADGRA